MPDIANLIAEAERSLADAGISDPARDARLLMRWAMQTDGAGLTSALGEASPPAASEKFRDAVMRRIAREPLSHITGRRAFWNHEFRVTSDVLDPRPETETLVAEALHRGPFDRILDLGVGSGCILLSLLASWPGVRGVGVDVSAPALAVARQNALEINVADRVRFVEGSWYEEVAGPFDLVISNPPYIRHDEMEHLSPEVTGFEPRIALTPGGDGLGAYRAIVSGASAVLNPNAMLMLEIGPTQSHEVAAVCAEAGLHVQSIIPDLDQRPRVIVARV
ncbi:MAG: peptide chain release factor N(5)-glutamine methyltransferase [Pseudomonadota bacterium]